MTEFKSMYNRADLQQLTSFLLYGVGSKRAENIVPENQMFSTSTELMRKLKDLNLEEGVYEELSDDIYQILSTYKEVYTKVGVKVGARMLFQLICEDSDIG